MEKANKNQTILIALLLTLALLVALSAPGVVQAQYYCYGWEDIDPQVCSNHGDCIATDWCICTPGWSGAQCERLQECNVGEILTITGECVPHCNAGFFLTGSNECAPLCAVACNDHSFCGATGICECKPGYTGENCDIPFCSSCGDNSTCVMPEMCVCNYGYTLDVAGGCFPVCSGGCGVNGVCVAPNTCACNDGYALIDGQCAPVCSGGCGVNSTCVAPDVCACDAGYSGNQCEINALETCSNALDSAYNSLETTQVGLVFCNYQLEQVSATVITPASSIDFGTVSVGAASQIQTVTVTANKNTTLGTIVLSGAQSSEYTLGGTCTNGATMSAGASCTVNVTFTPTATGPRSAILIVTTTAPVATLTTTLSGSGIIAISSIVIDPATPTTLFAALDGAGVYKSTDNGQNWIPATTQPASKRLKALVIKPGDSSTLFVAAYGGGVYVSNNTQIPFDSTNNGMAWNACAGQPTNLNLVSLTIDANGKLYAGTEGGVFVSADACGTWSAMNSGLP